MKLQKLVLLFPLFTLPSVALLFGYSSGPLPRHTAGFREPTCHQCHSSYRLDEGRTIGGVFEIRGVPKTYERGQVYPITVIVGQPGQSRWGFELSVRHTRSGNQAGQLASVDSTTQVKEEAGVQYIEHTSTGTREGTADGPVEFYFNWTAPDPSGGPVFFNAAGNAADDSGTPSGDYIYTAGAYSGVSGGAGNIPIARPSREEGGRSEDQAQTSKLVDLPAPVDLNKGSVEIHIQHRFIQSLSDSSAGDAFGIDFGANINLGVNYAFTNRFSAGVARARFDQVINFNGTYELQTRRNSFWKMSLLAGVEGKNNFEKQFSPFVQLATSFDYKALRLHVVPTAVFNSRDDTLVRTSRTRVINPGSDQTFSLGLGADIALNERLSLIGEIVPRLAGFGGFVKRQPEFSGGLEIRTPAHVFTILVSTSRDFGPSKYAVNADNSDVSLGFNIYRRIK
ncbi:MAG: DUF5777 family beta-barrel protein [Acidobacteriia bacterium]|nr:DUF5777 family beta-barrel protein [Terriglobia bacterium]